MPIEPRFPSAGLLALAICAVWSSPAFAQNPVPFISQALACGAVGVGGLGPGTDLQRKNLDLGRFPDARCNDGTGAVFYFRPSANTAAQNRWLIQLQGGGTCDTADDCAKRWCHVDTAFGMGQMTSTRAPKPGTRAEGILARRSDNPFGDWNHVLVRYCSSDLWSGTARDRVVNADDPATPKHDPRPMRLHFLGRRIVEAVIDTLRRDGTGVLTYGTGAKRKSMPDLDAAEAVVLAGASAGGAGVIHNVDDLATKLKAAHTRNCSVPGKCPRLAALLDSSFPPSIEQLDLSESDLCVESGLCTYDAVFMAEAEKSSVLWGAERDASCLAWHEAEAAGGRWRCSDLMHQHLHHVTTPMFVRMGQTDGLLQLMVPGYGVMDEEVFASIVRKQLEALGGIRSTAHEGGAMTVAAGAFGPTCGKHETLRNDDHTFDVIIRRGSTQFRFLDVWSNWYAGKGSRIVVTRNDETDVCP